MVRRRRLVDAARGFRLAELESARSVVLEPRIGQGGVLPSLAIPRLRLCACAHRHVGLPCETYHVVRARALCFGCVDRYERREYFESEFHKRYISNYRDLEAPRFSIVALWVVLPVATEIGAQY